MLLGHKENYLALANKIIENTGYTNATAEQVAHYIDQFGYNVAEDYCKVAGSGQLFSTAWKNSPSTWYNFLLVCLTD